MIVSTSNSMESPTRQLQLNWSQLGGNTDACDALQAAAQYASRDMWGLDVSAEIAAIVNDLFTALAAAVCMSKRIFLSLRIQNMILGWQRPASLSSSAIRTRS